MVYIVSNVLYQNVCFKNTILPRALFFDIWLEGQGGQERKDMFDSIGKYFQTSKNIKFETASVKWFLVILV